jgi:hypothetical protein
MVRQLLRELCMTKEELAVCATFLVADLGNGFRGIKSKTIVISRHAPF